MTGVEPTGNEFPGAAEADTKVTIPESSVADGTFQNAVAEDAPLLAVRTMSCGQPDITGGVLSTDPA